MGHPADRLVVDVDPRKHQLHFQVERAGAGEPSTPFETVESPS